MTTTMWPDFASLDTPIFPRWLKISVLDFIAAFPQNFEGLCIEFWATNYYDDNNNIKEHAGPGITWSGVAPTQDELDDISAMRRMERRAEEMWRVLPLEVDDEASICGEVSYAIDREGIRFLLSDWNESESIELYAVPRDGGWYCAAKIRHALEDYISAGASDTVMITMDADAVIAELDPSVFGLANFPKPKAIYTDEEEFVCIEFEIADYVGEWQAKHGAR